jgi:trk system potassium uptake protein
MKILILGAGQVGSSVAESLVSENNDITVVDSNADRLKDLQGQFDLRTVHGSAALPEVLEQAGARDTDMLFAVTASDEVNLVACKVAAKLFNVPTRIARIRSTDFQAHPELLGDDCFAVTHAICPEQIVTEYIQRLIAFPEAIQVLQFAEGKVSLVTVQAFEGGPLVRRPIRDLEKLLPGVAVKVAAIFRANRPVPIEPDTVIQSGDEVFCLAATRDIRDVMCEIRRMDKPIKRVMIAGGGNIGMRLASAIEPDHDVKVIEHNKRRCEMLAGRLARTLVLNGDVTDEDLLSDENVDETDLFVAVTNDDESNIMASMLAKSMGARRVVALVNRRAYANLVQVGSQIDVAISPSHITIGSLLEYVRRGDVVAVHSLRRGRAEALEVIAHGDRKSSRAIGRRLSELDLPKGASVMAILRGGKPIVADDASLVIEPEDHVILFAESQRVIPKVEKLFAVGVGFF